MSRHERDEDHIEVYYCDCCNKPMTASEFAFLATEDSDRRDEFLKWVVDSRKYNQLCHTCFSMLKKKGDIVVSQTCV